MVLDEPTSALDRRCRSRSSNCCASCRRPRTVLLFISHDLAVVRAMADYIVVMKRGKIVEEGPTEEIFSNPATNTRRR